MSIPDYQTLKTEKSNNGVFTITFNRPEVKNAFNTRMISELTQIFQCEAIADDVRAVVLTGKGGFFCSGGDLNWMKESVQLSFEENYKETWLLTEMFHTINNCPKPVLGVVQGAAIGGGVGLVSVCDIAIAETGTQFSLSEVRLGMVPACIGPFVISKIGASQARALFISAERFLAKRAYEAGLIHEYHDDADKLLFARNRILENILQCGPSAIKIVKNLVLKLSWPEERAQLLDPYQYVAKLLAEVRVSPEGQEGVRAFLEKRKPSWLKPSNP